MSDDIDDGEDLEFLTAFEDELYNESLSVGSDDSLDSELEAELYQSVHFASSLVETPTNIIRDKKDLNESTQSTGLELQIKQNVLDNQSDCEDGKSLDQIASEEEVKDTPQNFYPEVELVFSNDQLKNKLNKIQRSRLFTPNDESDASDNGVSDGDEWGIIHADLVPARKTKKLNVRCFNCNERGHRTLECTQPKKEKVCWLCGDIGHVRKRCPNELCFNCNEPGHQVKKCRKPRCRAEDTCNRCHAYGHFESFCPDRWRQYRHTTKEGEIVRGTQPNPERENIFCYNCGEQGHLGHECLEEREDSFLNPSYPFVVKYDRYTSHSAQNFNRNAKKNDSTRDNDKNTKQTRNKRKRSKSEVVDGGGRKAKRRKTADGWDDREKPRDNEWNYTEDNCDRMETFTDFRNVTTELPQPLMSLDLAFMKDKEGEQINSQKQNQFQNESTENITKKKKGKPGQRKRKLMRKKFMQQLQSNDNTQTNNTPLLTEMPKVKNKKGKTRKRKNSFRNKINLESLSSTTNFQSLTNSSAHVSKDRNTVVNRNQDKRIIKIINHTAKKAGKKETHKSDGNRKVFFNFPGFL